MSVREKSEAPRHRETEADVDIQVGWQRPAGTTWGQILCLLLSSMWIYRFCKFQFSVFTRVFITTWCVLGSFSFASATCLWNVFIHPEHISWTFYQEACRKSSCKTFVFLQLLWKFSFIIHFQQQTPFDIFSNLWKKPCSKTHIWMFVFLLLLQRLIWFSLLSHASPFDAWRLFQYLFWIVIAVEVPRKCCVRSQLVNPHSSVRSGGGRGGGGVLCGPVDSPSTGQQDLTGAAGPPVPTQPILQHSARQ